MKSHGFSLLEVLVAVSLLATGVAALGQLFVVASSASRAARLTTLASILAGQKIEALLADTPAPSPPGSLDVNTPGYSDVLDQRGQPGALFTRRWSVDPLPEDAASTFVIQVLVTTRTDGRAGAARSRLPDDVRLVSVRTKASH